MIKEALGFLLFQIRRISHSCLNSYLKAQLRSAGNNIYLGRGCMLTPKSIEIGDDVYIGDYCCLKSTHGRIIIGSHVMFGPGVHVHGGDHPFREIGKLINESTKASGSDGVVSIEDDCWIGSNAIILKGVTVHKGSVVAAGAIVSNDVPEYCIYIGEGSNAKIISRFSQEDLATHKHILKQRFS